MCVFLRFAKEYSRRDYRIVETSLSKEWILLEKNCIFRIVLWLRRALAKVVDWPCYGMMIKTFKYTLIPNSILMSLPNNGILMSLSNNVVGGGLSYFRLL